MSNQNIKDDHHERLAWMQEVEQCRSNCRDTKFYLVPTRCVGMQLRRAAPRVTRNVRKCRQHKHGTQRAHYDVPTQRVTAIKLRDTRVPKLPLGNPVSKAPALRAGKLELPVLNSQAGAWEPARKARCTASHEQRLNIRDAARGNESEISPRKSCPGAG